MENAIREAIDVFDTWRKLIRPIRIAKAWDWNDTSNQKQQRCVSRQNDSGRRETERDISSVVPEVLSELFCFLFKLIQTGHFTQIHSFFLVRSEEIVNITWNSWITSYSYPHSDFCHTFLLMYFVFSVVLQCVAANFSIQSF